MYYIKPKVTHKVSIRSILDKPLQAVACLSLGLAMLGFQSDLYWISRYRC